MPSGNFSPMSTRKFRPRTCALCGKEWLPNGPRAKRCPTCVSAKCHLCGDDISESVSLVRAARNPNRLCMRCHLTNDKKRVRGGLASAKIGTMRIEKSGYVSVKCEDGWILEHRFVMEQKIGRKLEAGEIVHYMDENRANNHPANLALCSGLRDHLETYHADILKNPPLHHNGRKKKGDSGYIPIAANDDN